MNFSHALDPNIDFLWKSSSRLCVLYIYINALSRCFYPKRLTVHSGYTFLFYQYCVPWEMNPQPFALLTQCFTTEPQEHLCHVCRCGCVHFGGGHWFDRSAEWLIFAAYFQWIMFMDWWGSCANVFTVYWAFCPKRSTKIKFLIWPLKPWLHHKRC